MNDVPRFNPKAHDLQLCACCVEEPRQVYLSLEKHQRHVCNRMVCLGCKSKDIAHWQMHGYMVRVVMPVEQPTLFEETL